METDFQNAIHTLKQNLVNTEEKIIDIREYQFEIDTESNHYVLKNMNDGDLLVFPELNAFPLQQLCKMSGVPYSFFVKNPSTLKQQIAEVWIPQVKDPAVLVKTRRVGDGERSQILRAILPSTYVTVTNADIFNTMSQNIDLENSHLQIFEGQMPDDVNTHFRVTLPEKFYINSKDEMRLGFSVLCSEVDHKTPLELNALVYRVVCENGMVVKYHEDAYYKQHYRGIQAQDLGDIFDNMVERVIHDMDVFRDRISDSTKDIQEDGVRQLIRSIKDRRDISRKFSDVLDTEIVNTISEYRSVYDVVNKITNLAQTYPIVKRLQYEGLGGELLGLELLG